MICGNSNRLQRQVMEGKMIEGLRLPDMEPETVN